MKNRRKHITARNIASLYHGGGGSALYVLASTGAIVLNDQDMEWLNVRDEVGECIKYIDDPDTRHDEFWTAEVAQQERTELQDLLHYIEKHGSRGPVEGWGQLRW